MSTHVSAPRTPAGRRPRTRRLVRILLVGLTLSVPFLAGASTAAASDDGTEPATTVPAPSPETQDTVVEYFDFEPMMIVPEQGPSPIAVEGPVAETSNTVPTVMDFEPMMIVPEAPVDFEPQPVTPMLPETGAELGIALCAACVLAMGLLLHRIGRMGGAARPALDEVQPQTCQ